MSGSMDFMITVVAVIGPLGGDGKIAHSHCARADGGPSDEVSIGDRSLDG